MNPEVDETPFDFSKYSVDPSKDNIPTQTIPQQEENGTFDFNKYKVPEPETKAQAFGRHATRTASRAVESILGFPGDIVGFAKFLDKNLPSGPSYLEPEPSFLQKGSKKLLEKIPGSDELKEFSSYLTSGFTDPKSANEELGDEITSLATILINPSRAASGFSSLLKNIGKSVAKASAVKGAGKGSELLGADEKTKAGVEIGTLFLTGLMGSKTADKFVSEQYSKSRSKIHKGEMIPTNKLEQSLNSVEKELSKGISTPTKDEVKKSLSELKAKASGGAMEVDEIVQSVHDINEKMSSKKLFDELSSTERKLLKKRYDLVKNEVHKEIASYGKSNPEFFKQWTSANQGFATIAQSKQVSNFLQSKLGKLPNHLVGSVALDLFLESPVATVGVLGGYGSVKTGELLYRVAKSPTLRNHYMKVLMEASNENLPGMVKNLNALDKELKKDAN